MSPEQVRGTAVDRRADIFALGIILWELTTARRLFRGDDTLDTIARVLELEIPRPTTLVRGYPADLEAVVMGALTKERDQRFDTAHDFARALTGVLFRRGLFVTGDDVFHYMQAVFHDRIQERDAVLRTSAALSLRREPSRPNYPSEAETAPLPLVHSSRMPSAATMSIQTHEIEGSIDVVLDDADIIDVRPSPVTWVERAPQKRSAVNVAVLALTIMAMTLLGFALAISLVLLFS